MADKTDAAGPPHYPDGVAPVPVPGTQFVELEGRYPGGSAEEASFRLIRRVIFLSQRWRSRVDEELRRAGQTHARWITLVWIRILDGKANHSQIAEQVGVELPTLIRLLNRLEAEGLVRRASLPGGGRAKTVVLTEAGSAVVDETNALTQAVQQSFFVGLNKEDVDACSAILDAMVRNTGPD